MVQRVSQKLGLAPTALLGKSRAPALARARHLLAYVWIERLGQRASDLARLLDQTRGNVSRAAKRGAATAQPWLKMMDHWCP
jgi:hypothetical protein